MWKGYFDGACDNTGSKDMQIGAVLIHDGAIIEKISRKLGKGTSNVAEYLALITLLECCIDRGLYYGPDRGSLHIFGDSKLVVQQVNGHWKVKAPHLLIYRERARFLNQEIRARLFWIPRAQNTIADGLSKLQENL